MFRTNAKGIEHELSSTSRLIGAVLLFVFCFFQALGPIKSGICLSAEPRPSEGLGEPFGAVRRPADTQDGMDLDAPTGVPERTARPNSMLLSEQSEKTEMADVLEDVWDSDKYISIDEIQPGMEAYCLTCYKGTEIEKFGLDVISVVRDVEPGRDVILVQGTDERFIHTGPVGGCSGSPVYIDGRLAGALAFAWSFSKDPLYGVTPIGDMLKVGSGSSRVKSAERDVDQVGFVFDFSRPIDFAEIYTQIASPRISASTGLGGISPLPCPLITSGLPAGVCEQLESWVKPFGFIVVPGISSTATPTPSGQGQDAAVQLEPGAVLVVPLISGDMVMFVLGTATLVSGDKVYGFGHSFLGYGPVDLPMATGQVHTVVSSLARSFKLGSMGEIVGALTVDESAAVLGRIGAKAKTIPLTIKIDRYNDTDVRVYNCQIVDNQMLTPTILRMAIAGAALYLGDFPPDHMIEYKTTIALRGADAINFENVSTNVSINEVLLESIGSVALLMNNPFRKVDIESFDLEIRVEPRNIVSHIWSVDLSDSKVKAGEEIEIDVIVESFLAGMERYQFRLKIPEGLPEGKYDLTVCGSGGYGQFLRKAVPYKFIAHNFSDLIEVLNNSLQIKRDKLYCLLTLPPGGVAVEKSELPDLPATKALVLQNAKRTLRTQPYQRWLEKSLETDTVVVDRKVMYVTVEK